jgi:sugar/nucleoside kinase (ribokinase family)
MTGSQGWASPDVQVLRYALEKLRMREGLTVPRLDGARNAAASPLLGLSAVRRHADLHELKIPQAALEVISLSVREGLRGTAQIVADVVLGLGVLAGELRRAGVPARVVDGLYSDSLGRRRGALLAHWGLTHRALGLEPPEPPSDRSLRASTEPDALNELAEQLARPEVHPVGLRTTVPPSTAAAAANGSAGRPTGRVMVVGGAVMDATFRTKSLPQVETSSEAHDFDLSPGGKGLTQAVAAARLGLDVSLVAAVGDDQFGREIVQYLRNEGVDTSLIKVVPDAHTPFTGIIEFELGNSIAVNWRNAMEVRLDVRDVERLRPRLGGCDAMLITFEPPRETTQRAVAMAHESPGHRPIVIVTPGQPYPDSGISGQALAQIDYLVAHAWELGRYAPRDRVPFDVDAVAQRLLAYGVETLCVPIGGGCTIYSEALGTFSVPTYPSTYKESSAARDAFCAALAAKLIDTEGIFSAEVALWATAAMASATADYPLSNSMPDRHRIEQLLRVSRFVVAPREAPDRSSNGIIGEDARVPRAE